MARSRRIAGNGVPGMTGRDRTIEWRLLLDPPAAPAWNMAVDEALLEAWRPGQPAVFRVYGWSPAALSLGRFQPAADVPCPAGAVLVRRISGGAAIHHREDEVTYALVAPYRLFGGPRAAYQAVHGLVAAALEALGVPAAGREGERAPRARPAGMCFSCATAEDLVVGGKKLVGSAQRRRGGAFLQHGSIPLSADPRAPGSTSLVELLGAPIERGCVQRALVNALRHTLGSDPVPGGLNEAERQIAGDLYETRYNAPAWTHER